MFAAEVIGAGGRVWTTLACRDRNRVVLEQELAGLAAVGVDGVLCVTGDGRGVSVRPGVTQVFDLDGVRLTALAAGMGLAVAVPESPEAPPVTVRPARVAEKQRAGAQVCVLNHVSSPEQVAAFVVAARAAGVTLPFIAGVAVYTDERSARVLQRFPGLHLDDAVVERCWPRPTRGRRASPPPSRRRGRCWRSPGRRREPVRGGIERGRGRGCRGQGGDRRAAEREFVTELESEAMEAEFDTVAGWTEEAVAALGPEYAIPAGCRGSGSEGGTALARRPARARSRPRLLDDGAGVGGPAGWLAAERGVRPVCAEPMAAAVRASRRLFGLPSLVAMSQALPLADGSFDAAWCLGVLCTTSDKATALAELRRVLRPGARLGLLVFVADGVLTPPLPEGNEFPSEGEVLGLLRDAGFALEDSADADLSDSSAAWTERADAVDAEVRAATRARPGVPAGAGERPTGWGGCSQQVSCGRGSGWPPRSELTGCKETLAKNSLHS